MLLMSGGLGMVALDRVAEQLLAISNDLQLITLAGRNKKLLSQLEMVRKKASDRVVVVGYTQAIERLMAASSLAVGKSGGLTGSECLTWHKHRFGIFPVEYWFFGVLAVAIFLMTY